MAKLTLHNYNMTLKFKNCQQCFVMRLWFKILFSVSDPHQDDADPDPRIRISRCGSGSGSYSLKIPSVFFIPLFGSLVNISPFYFIEMNNLFYPFEIIDKID